MTLTTEKFDLNYASVTGTVYGVWGRGEDIFARISLDEDGATFTTARFAGGRVASKPISLHPGMKITAQGYLSQNEYKESLQHFVDDAKVRSALDLVASEDRAVWEALAFPRRNTILNVEAARIGETEFGRLNGGETTVEGIVSRVWEYPHASGIDLFARLAVYDEHTRAVEQNRDEHGRVYRSPHYVTICVDNGQVMGFPVSLSAKQRIRISGFLRERSYKTSLHEEILKLGKPEYVEMLQRVRDVERFSEISTTQRSLHVAAQSVVIYSYSGGSRPSRS